MSGLDDSLSDVAKKKYPFELEKAIHNVMFIQHHMTKQDEFNAVSGTKHAPTNFISFASSSVSHLRNCGGKIHCCLCSKLFDKAADKFSI